MIMISSLLKYIINFNNIEYFNMTHYGLLLLFPIDKQYDYIVEKHFTILFKKQIKINIISYQQQITMKNKRKMDTIKLILISHSSSSLDGWIRSFF